MFCPQCKKELPDNDFDWKEEKGKPIRRKCVCRACTTADRERSRAQALAKGKMKPRESDRYVGYKSYTDYLNSKVWKAIRLQVFEIKGRFCWLCGIACNQVHHQRYRKVDLNGTCLDFLFPICADCHTKIEFEGAKKRKKLQVRKMFNQLRNQYVAQLKEISTFLHKKSVGK